MVWLGLRRDPLTLILFALDVWNCWHRCHGSGRPNLLSRLDQRDLRHDGGYRKGQALLGNTPECIMPVYGWTLKKIGSSSCIQLPFLVVVDTSQREQDRLARHLQPANNADTPRAPHPVIGLGPNTGSGDGRCLSRVCLSLRRYSCRCDRQDAHGQNVQSPA